MSNYTYHGTTDLVTLPQRNVQTFPSGLVRVDRVYACRKNLANRYRRDLAVGNPLPLDPGTPAIDGLYIFPEPQEVVRDDGFSEFRVSAYGRINTRGQRRFDFVQGETKVTQTSLAGQIGTTGEASISTLNQALVQTFVNPADRPFAIDFGLRDDDLEVYLPNGSRLQETFINGTRAIGSTSVTTQSFVEPTFGGVTTQNFGVWTEVTISFVAVGRVLIVRVSS